MAAAQHLPLAVAAVALLLGLPSPASAAADLPVVLRYNHDCFAPALVVVGDGDCDAQQQTFVAESLPKAGPLTVRGIRFVFPSSARGAKNSLVATGQVVRLPAKRGYSFLHALVFATNAQGGVAGGRATVVYRGNTGVPASLTGHDWHEQPGRAALRARGQSVLNPGSMSPLGPASTSMFLATVKLDPRRTVDYVQLPFGMIPDPVGMQRTLHVVAMTLSDRSPT